MLIVVSTSRWWMFRKSVFMFSIFVQNIVYTSIPRYDGTDQMKGMHGYDNADSDMRAIFLASGPGTYNVIYILKYIQLKNISIICCPFP